MTRRPTTPGEVLRTEFMEPRGITPATLADAMGIVEANVVELIDGRQPVTSREAYLLSHVFGTSVLFWLNLQKRVDMYDTEALR